MATTIPEGFRYLFTKAAFANLAVCGEVVELTEEGADAHIDKLAKRYLGKDRYPFGQPGEVRVIFKTRPERVSAMG